MYIKFNPPPPSHPHQTKAELHREAAKVLIDYIASIERATEFAERVNVDDVWVMLGKAQLRAMMVTDSIDSFIKANDASEYVAVITAADAASTHAELATYLVMCRKKVKEAHIDTSLIYAYCKSEQYAALEEFISAPNVGRIQDVAERCYAEEMLVMSDADVKLIPDYEPPIFELWYGAILSQHHTVFSGAI